jgi:hypothetical protein
MFIRIAGLALAIAVIAAPTAMAQRSTPPAVPIEPIKKPYKVEAMSSDGIA